MPTVKTQATEMKSARVDRISLVSKAASRIPFKVIKEDRTMSNPFKQTLDLASVGAIFKAQKPVTIPPSVVAIAAMKGDTLTQALVAVQEAGFSVLKSEEQEDGSVVLQQTDSDNFDDTVVIKMGDHTALIVKGYTPYSMEMDSAEGTTFSDVCKAQGFYPGLSATMSTLASSVHEAVIKADDQTSAAALVTKMFDEARNYAVSLTEALPANAFKLDSFEPDAPPTVVIPVAVVAPTVVADDFPDEVTKGDWPMTAEEKAAWPLMTAEEKTAWKAKQVAKAGIPAGVPAKTPAMKADDVVVTKAAAPDFATLLSEGLLAATAQLTTKMGDMLTSVQKSVEGVQASVEGLATKVAQVEGVAKAAKAAVEGTVMGHDAGGDATTSVQKSGDHGYGRGREIDTGMVQRRRAATR